jgi:hypothetical protein
MTQMTYLHPASCDTGSIGQSHDECQRDVDSGYVCVVEVADLAPDALGTDRDGLIGHDLRSHSQAILLAWLDGHAPRSNASRRARSHGQGLRPPSQRNGELLRARVGYDQAQFAKATRTAPLALHDGAQDWSPQNEKGNSQKLVVAFLPLAFCFYMLFLCNVGSGGRI